MTNSAGLPPAGHSRPVPSRPAPSRPALSARLRRVLAHDTSATALLLGSGTAPVPPELSDAFYRQYGIPVLVKYGATEFAGAIARWSLPDCRLFWPDKRGSVGRVHPSVIEDALRAHPAVSDAASVGLPDERLGEVPAAAVTLRPAAEQGATEQRAAEQGAAGQAATEQGLLDYLATRLTRYQLPVLIRVLDELPRTPSRKVDRPRLREIVLGDPGGQASEEVTSHG
jgi:long-chain acyl-CoA synthetase